MTRRVRHKYAMLANDASSWRCVLTLVLVTAGCGSADDPAGQGSVALPDSFVVPAFVNEWAAIRIPNGALAYPGTATVSREGTLLVADTRGFYEYSSDGDSLGVWGVAVDGDTLSAIHVRYRYNRYYVYAFSLRTRYRLLVYDGNRRLLRNSPALDTNGSIPFASLDADPCGNVYILAFDDELVVKYDQQGEFETQWYTRGTNASGSSWPGGIVVSPRGKVYVSDTLHHRLLVFDVNGKLLDEWGEYGSGPGQFHWPDAIDSDRWGFLYVVDILNYRVQKLSPDGMYLGEFSAVIPPHDDHSTAPYGIAVGGQDIYVIYPTSNLIRRFAF